MAYNQVVISSGHSVNCQGMADVINEVNEAIRVTNRVHDIIKASGKSCYKYHDTARTSSQNLANIVNFHNQYSGGVDVSVHFNACNHTNNAMGVEVCYCIQSTSGLASEMSSAIAKAGGLKNRGAKHRTGLYFLNKTKKPAILLEVCFGDSTTDCQLYRNNFEAICQAIARTLIGNIAVGNTATNNKKEEMNYSMYVFSKEWYLKRYTDVARDPGYKANPYSHYANHGIKEGRLPIPPVPKEYNEGQYLELNPDVANAVKKGTYTSGLHHYLCWGFGEQRKVCHADTAETINKRIKALGL